MKNGAARSVKEFKDPNISWGNNIKSIFPDNITIIVANPIDIAIGTLSIQKNPIRINEIITNITQPPS